ncbi:MAG: alpha/beta fold hydrolase [Caldilineaceae bacterium]
MSELSTGAGGRLATPAAVLRPLPQPDAALRLFCLPYAGAGASVYHAWSRLLPPTIELCAVQLPGREVRVRETPYTRFGEAITGLGEALCPLLDRPYALFGHSLGALLAFELARWFRHRGHPEPEVLFVSSRRPPQLPEPYPPVADLPDEEFTAKIQERYGGIPQVILQEPELMRMFLPILRADFKVLESYRYSVEPPLACALAVFGGSEDAIATPSALHEWQQHTAAAFSMRQFAGGHFYLQTARAEVVASVVDVLLASNLLR